MAKSPRKAAKRPAKKAARKATSAASTPRTPREGTIREQVKSLLKVGKGVPMTTLIKQGYKGRDLPKNPASALTRVFAGITHDDPKLKVRVKSGEAIMERA